MEKKQAYLSRKGKRWYDSGHTWIFADDISRLENVQNGDIVTVLTEENRVLGQATYSAKSKIALRLLSRQDEPIDEKFWLRRIDRAITKRKEKTQHDNTGCFPFEPFDSKRIIFSEGDFLPGLIVDLYDKCLVIQTMTLAMERQLPLLLKILRDRIMPTTIVCRNDASGRTLEGLPLEQKILFGPEPGLVEIEESGLTFFVDVRNGHKTGAYLDQKENRRIVQYLAKGRVLDAFCYNGQFSLLAAKCADDVISIDCSGDSLAILEENIQANHLKNITPIEGNVFDILTDYDKQNERFDTIILDPPPFAKSGSKTPGARRGYHEINSRAMRLLQPDGILATFSCSYNIGRDEFLAEIRQAAAKVHRSFSVVKELTQSSDHPTLLNTPETRYLTGFVLRMEE